MLLTILFMDGLKVGRNANGLKSTRRSRSEIDTSWSILYMGGDDKHRSHKRSPSKALSSTNAIVFACANTIWIEGAC